jgi:hypothetical protein
MTSIVSIGKTDGPLVHAWAENDRPACGGAMERGDSLHRNKFNVTCAACVPLVTEGFPRTLPRISPHPKGYGPHDRFTIPGEQVLRMMGAYHVLTSDNPLWDTPEKKVAVAIAVWNGAMKVTIEEDPPCSSPSASSPKPGASPTSPSTSG